MRMKVLFLGVVVALVLAVGVLLSSPGATFADDADGNSHGCSEFGQMMPPVTPGFGLGKFISERAQDGMWNETVMARKADVC